MTAASVFAFCTHVVSSSFESTGRVAGAPEYAGGRGFAHAARTDAPPAEAELPLINKEAEFGKQRPSA